jgi:hypothetical protein
MKPKEYIRKKFLRRSILKYYHDLPPEERAPEWAEVVRWLEKHKVFVFPYDFTKRYRATELSLHLDRAKGLFYTEYRGHRLYYKDGESARRARRYFNSVFMEQDLLSPHRYLTEDFDVEEGDVVVDIGAAEGNFALDVVERAKKIWLFEADPAWQKALQATFAPWEEKVEIVPERVADRTEEGTVALDDFFRDRDPFDFIKIDVDGAEAQVIRGMEKLIRGKKIKRIALCTYHRQRDAEIFSELLRGYGYEVTFSRGYMIFRKRIEPPYLRRGVLKATLR